MAVPYTFATATSAIPLSNLDSNFATAITLGSTATYLGNTTTTIAGLTLTSPTLTTPALGTPASGVLTNCTGYPGSAISGTINLATQVTGTLPVLNGGTGVTSSTGTGNVVLSTTPTLVTPILGTPTSGTLTNTTGFPAANLAGTALPAAIVTSSLTAVGTIATGVWNGTAIAIANGGTGQTTAGAAFNALSPITTTGDLILGNGTNSATRLAIGTNGYVLTVSGGTAVWAAAAGGGTQATATALGTVYAKQTTGGGAPYLTAFGYNAGVSTTGNGNTAIGTQALFTNSTGGANTAIGYQSSIVNNGDFTTACGYLALTANTSGGSNSSFGAYSLTSNTTGSYNTAVGLSALNANTTGTQSVAVGYQSLYTSTCSYTTAIGYQAGYKCSDVAYGGIFVGHQSGYNQTSATQSTIMGVQAGYSNVTSNNNTYNGFNAGYYQTGGTNTGVGSLALIGASGTSTGANNTGIGAQSLNACTTGSNNTAVGFQSGLNVVTGGGNVLIGINATLNATNDSTSIVIGNYNLVGKGGATGFISPQGGGVYQGNNSATWSVTSDQRLKKNIVDNNVGLDKIAQIQVRNFEYRTENEITDLPKTQVIKKEGVQLGAIAQEIIEILPDCVKTETTGVMSLNTDNIMWHMINAIKELNAEITALKAKVGV